MLPAKDKDMGKGCCNYWVATSRGWSVSVLKKKPRSCLSVAEPGARGKYINLRHHPQCSWGEAQSCESLSSRRKYKVRARVHSRGRNFLFVWETPSAGDYQEPTQFHFPLPRNFWKHPAFCGPLRAWGGFVCPSTGCGISRWCFWSHRYPNIPSAYLTSSFFWSKAFLTSASYALNFLKHQVCGNGPLACRFPGWGICWAVSAGFQKPGLLCLLTTCRPN